MVVNRFQTLGHDYEGDEGTVGKEDVRNEAKGRVSRTIHDQYTVEVVANRFQTLGNDYEGDEGTVGKEDARNEAKGRVSLTIQDH